MRSVLLIIASSWLCCGATCFPSGGEAGPADFAVRTSAERSFAGFRGGTDQEEPGTLFGPAFGYPEPDSILESFLGDEKDTGGRLGRGSFIVFETTAGDLSEVTADIVDFSGNVVATPAQDPESGPTRIGIQIPCDLEGSSGLLHTLVLRTPNDHVIASVDFRLGRECDDPETGWFVDEGDQLAIDFVKPSRDSATLLPVVVDLSRWLPPARKQGAQGSCVGFALGYALKTFHEARENGWGVDDLKDPSHQYIPSYSLRSHQPRLPPRRVDSGRS